MMNLHRPEDYAGLASPSSPQAAEEWKTFLSRRQDLLDQIMGRLKAHEGAIMHGVLDPKDDPRKHVDEQINQQAVEQSTFREQVGTSQYNDMLGQAEFYGIGNAESIPPQQLQRLIEQRRSGVLNERINAGEFDPGQIMKKGVASVQTALGAIFVGATGALIDMSQNVPFIGDILAKTETIRKADQWVNKVAEGYSAGLTDEEQTGWRIAHGLGGMLGYTLPASANFALLNEAAGAIPVVARLSPIARAAIVGGTDAWMLAGGGDAPLQERGINILLGAGLGGANELGGPLASGAFGAAAGSAIGASTGRPHGAFEGAVIGGAGGVVAGTMLPRMLARAQASFRSQFSEAGLQEGPQMLGGPNNFVEGQWEFDQEPAGLLANPATTTPQSSVRMPDQGGPGAPNTSSSPPAAVEQANGGLQVSRGPLDQLQTAASGSGNAELQAQINDLIEQRNLARRQAEQHPLTGLPNRRAFDAARPQADADPNLGYVVMDAKNFKSINDQLGHSQGDAALQNFAAVLQNTAQNQQIPARIFHFGGDEFAAIVPKEKMGDFAAAVEKDSQMKFKNPRLADYPAVKDEATGKVYTAPSGRDMHGDAYASMVSDVSGMPWDQARSAIAGLSEHPVVDELMNRSTSGVVVDGQYLAEGTPEHDAFMTEAIQNPKNIQTSLDAFGGATFDEADQGLMRYKEATRNPQSRLQPQQARGEANQLTKQAVIMQSPDLADIAQKPVFHETDVIKSAQATNPGQTVVMSGVDPHMLPRLAEAYPDAHLIPRMDYLGRAVSMDMLVGATPKQAADYQRHGIFEGQRVVTSNGVEAVVKKFTGKEGIVQVESLNKRGPGFKSKIENLAPSNTSAQLVDGQAEYHEFRNNAISKMNEESSKAGLRDFDWLSPEMSSQLPRYMEDYFSSNGIEGTPKAMLEQYFNYARLGDYRTLAPAEFDQAAQLTRDAADLIGMREESTHPYPYTVEDTAASKGFEYQVSDNQSEVGAGVLRDQLSNLQVPVANEEAALEFLHGFVREVPDLTPESIVPAELIDMVPGGSGPVDGPEPAWNDTETHTLWSENLADSAEEDWTRLQANTLARNAESGGGGGNFGGGGGNSLPPNPPLRGLPGSGESPGEQFRRADPRRLAQALMKQDSFTMRWLEPMRNWVINSQEQLREAGIKVPLFRGYSDVTNGVAVMHNESGPWMDEWAGIVSGFRHKFQRDGTVVKIEQLGNWNDKLAAMQKAGYTPDEMAAQASIRPFFDKAWGEARGGGMIGYLFDYLPALRNLQARGPKVSDPFGQWEKNHLPSDWQWFARYPRAHGVQARHTGIADLGTLYIRGLFFEKHVAPAWNLMKSEWAHPDIPEALAQPVNGWLNLVQTGQGAQNDVMISGLRHVMNQVGLPVTDSDVRSLYGGIFGNLYRSFLGFSPSAIFRDSIQPLFTGTELGFEYTNKAYMGWMDKGQRDQMWERALKGGWVQKGQTRVAYSDVFDKPFETQGGDPIFSDAMQARRETFATILDKLYDITPRKFRGGIQGTVADPLMAYTRLGEFNRLIAGEAGWLKADETMRKYLSQPMTIEQAMSESGASIYEKPIADRARELLTTSQYDEFRNLLANEAGNSQFRYGTMEQSIGVQQAGMIGRASMMLGNFATQYWTRMRSNLRNLTRNGDVVGAAAFTARQTAIWAAISAASAYTGWKGLERYKWHKSLAFGGGPVAAGMLGVAEAGAGTISTALGQRPAPEQTDAMNRFGSAGFDALNPLAGGFRNLNGLIEGLGSPIPFESSLRGITTGEYGTGRAFKSIFDNTQFWDQYKHGSVPAPVQSINDLLSLRRPPQGQFGDGIRYDTQFSMPPLLPQEPTPGGGSQ